MSYDPYENDPGMKELHQRDLRNSATPVHTPVVQHVDYEAAEEEGRLDEAQADAPEGDADHAVAVAESVEEQEAALEPDVDEPVAANTPPEDNDGESPINAFGNVAPEHATESDADRDADKAPVLAPATQTAPVDRRPGYVDNHDELARDDDEHPEKEA